MEGKTTKSDDDLKRDVDYVREVASRTEQYWCPIKHARRVISAHDHYAAFLDDGDAEAYRRELPILRKDLQKSGAQGDSP